MTIELILKVSFLCDSMSNKGSISIKILLKISEFDKEFWKFSISRLSKLENKQALNLNNIESYNIEFVQ